MEYRATRPFKMQGKNIKAGDKVEARKQDLQKLKRKNLIYETKEDKRAYNADAKATIEHYGGKYFLVKQGDQVIDKLPKSEAEEKRDEINGAV